MPRVTDKVRFKIRKGLDLPISGEPEQTIHPGPPIRTVALIGPDHVGMRPTMAVSEGDEVALGQVLFSDKKTPGVQYTSPAAGKVVAIHRGAKRAFLSVVIEVDGDAEADFSEWKKTPVSDRPAEDIEAGLLAAGLWQALRTRPYSRTPVPGTRPASIFVTAIDTNPLAADPERVVATRRADFHTGLVALKTLSVGPVYVCTRPESGALLGMPTERETGTLVNAEFTGPHPAGLAGTHIHRLDPVSADKTVWTIGYQDVLAIGTLFREGKIDVERVISIAGPLAKSPRLVRTRLGASIEDLTAGEVNDEVASDPESYRAISGSILSGRSAAGPLAWLGRYHLQVTLLGEGRERDFLGWQRPGFDKFSIKRVFAGSLIPGKKFKFTTSTEGSRRAMVPIGTYESVMPLDIIPTFLLRSLIVDNTDQAQALGCLELDEEDLGLCTFVCPGKYEYGPILRRNLTAIEKDG